MNTDSSESEKTGKRKNLKVTGNQQKRLRKEDDDEHEPLLGGGKDGDGNDESDGESQQDPKNTPSRGRGRGATKKPATREVCKRPSRKTDQVGPLSA